jgi:hypothetical protein
LLKISGCLEWGENKNLDAERHVFGWLMRSLLPAYIKKHYSTSYFMAKSGIKIISETLGDGPELKKGNRIRLKYDIQLNQGDFLVRDQEVIWTVGDRNFVAGFSPDFSYVDYGNGKMLGNSSNLLS